ncbi:hypothetical protein KY363_07425 [Candidatus Woesearchaeota archaeon]|nr:hypothetical protein [Candidatus Woesearchaeota archaeon]
MARQDIKQLKQADAETADLFRQHLAEHHHVKTDSEFSSEQVRQHLSGTTTVLPVTVFSNTKLSTLEASVKYLRENEGLQNSAVADLLGRSQAAIWITYRNACRKLQGRIDVGESKLFIPTDVLSDEKLSALESISTYLHSLGNSYRKVGQILKRDERTIWTACERARRKMAS